MHKPFDIAIVILDNGFTSTAIGPMEVFYCAGRLMQLLLGEPELPRFHVRMASVDGKPVTSVYGISLVPNIQERLKLPSVGWLPVHIETMLALRPKRATQE